MTEDEEKIKELQDKINQHDLQREFYLKENEKLKWENHGLKQIIPNLKEFIEELMEEFPSDEEK